MGCRKQLLGPRAPCPARVQLWGGFHGTSQLLLPLAAPKAVIKRRQTLNYRGAAAGGLGGVLGPCPCTCRVLPAKGAVLGWSRSRGGIGIFPWPQARQGSLSTYP